MFQTEPVSELHMQPCVVTLVGITEAGGQDAGNKDPAGGCGQVGASTLLKAKGYQCFEELRQPVATSQLFRLHFISIHEP